jgi:hypothetical protein
MPLWGLLALCLLLPLIVSWPIISQKQRSAVAH